VARSVGPERRRAAHLALAATLEDQPDRATWHRALAATGADERLANDLEAGAGRAVSRGAPDVAQEWFERAAQVSIDDARRGHRLVSAAELAFELGRHQMVGDLMSQARATPLSPADYARLAGLEGVFDEGIGGHEDDVRRLTDAAMQALGEGDHEVAAALLLGAAMPCYWGGTDDALWALVRDGIDAVDLPEQDPRIMVVRALTDPYERGGLLVSQLAGWAAQRPTDPALVSALGRTAFVIGDFDHALEFAHQASETLRHEGRLALLTATLVLETFASLYLGRWGVTKVAAGEAHRFASETRQPVWEACANLGRANLLGVEGADQDALALAAHVEKVALDAANRSLINGVQLTRGLAGLGAGRPEHAFVELARMFDRSDPAYHAAQSPWAVDYLAEAAALSHHRDEGARILNEVEAHTKDTPAPGVRRAVTLARALLCDPDKAEADFDAARGLSAVAAPWYRARVELAYGSWLRRQRRVAESRQPLIAAQAMFVALEADAWNARTQQELAATGRRARERSPEAWSKLSAQELQIVRLAAEGLSNREIGERLYLSHRTVGSHLYRAFPKLGVRTRAELHAAIAQA
jgi:DNA-binding CsgD family transcriptional regulator